MPDSFTPALPPAREVRREPWRPASSLREAERLRRRSGLMSAAPPALERFAELFNRGEYWASHEVLEAPWRGNGSRFYKGLILYASAWVHAQRGNRRGVEAQLRKAMRELEPYRPAYLGVRISAVLDHAASALRQASTLPQVEALLPPPPLEISLHLVSGDEPELASLPDIPPSS